MLAVASSSEGLQIVSSAGILVCIALALPNSSERSVELAFMAGVAGWLCLITYAFQFMRARSLVLFAPLFLLYFFATRHARLDGDLEILFTDSNRFVALATSWSIEDRHFGWSVFGYLFHPLKFIGEAYGAPRLGFDILYAQTAFAGTLAAAVLYQAADIVKSRFSRALLTYVFSLSFATWTVSMAVDTYIYGALFLVLHFEVMKRWFGHGAASPVALGFCTAAAMTFSFEAAYLLPFVIGSFILFRPFTGIPYRQLAAYALSAVLAFAAVAAVYLLVRSFGFQNISTHIANYADVGRLFSPQAFLQITSNEFLSSIIAQRGFPNVTGRYAEYGFTVAGAFTAANVVYVVFMISLLAIAGVGLARLRDARTAVVAGLCLLLFVGRHMFMMMWDPQESLIFSLPSAAAIVLLIAVGLRAREPFDRTAWLAQGILAALVVLLLVVNGFAITEYY